MSESLYPGGDVPGCAHCAEPDVPDSIAALQNLWGAETEVEHVLQQAAQPLLPGAAGQPAGSDCAVNALSDALQKYKAWTHAANIMHPEGEKLAFQNSGP